MKFEPANEEMNKYLVELGFRRRPVLAVLPRENPINKFLGILFRRTIPNMLKKKKS